MNTILINKHLLAHLKGKMHEDSITSDIWGAELADGASDWGATEVTFQVRSRYHDNRLHKISVFNNGQNLPVNKIENDDGGFLSFPTTKNSYGPNMIGVRGAGTKLTIFRVGFVDYIASFDEDGRFYIAKAYYCSDENGETEIDFSDDLFTKENFQNKVLSIRIDIEYYDDWNDVPGWIELDDDGKGLEYGINWFKDSDIKFDETKIKRWLSARFGQTKNFKIYFEDETSDKILRSEVPKTHFGILNQDNNPIYQYKDLTKHGEVIEVQGEKFEIYYGCRISQVNDTLKYKKLQKETKKDYQLKSLRPIRGESPLLVHMNSTDIIVTIDHLSPSEFDASTSWLIFFIKPKRNINSRYAINKSNGYSDEEFGNELRDKIKTLIKDNKLKNNYHDASKKAEDSEVVQWVDYVAHPESTEIQKDIKRMTGGSKEDITKKKNWKTFKVDDSKREIDLRNELIRLWMEWQASNKNSDTEHLDGIASRINLVGRQSSPYDTFIWVAKKHNHVDELKNLLKGFDWGDNHLKQVVFLTTDEVFSGFDLDEVPVIDIENDIING